MRRSLLERAVLRFAGGTIFVVRVADSDVEALSLDEYASRMRRKRFSQDYKSFMNPEDAYRYINARLAERSSKN